MKFNGIKSLIRKIKNFRKPMTDEQYNKKVEKARKIARDKVRKKKIHSIKHPNKQAKPRKHFEFSKIIVLVTFVMCMEVLIFSQVLLYKTMDTSALYSLIAIPTTLVPILFGYFNKSKQENILKIGQNAQYDNSINDFELNQNSVDNESTGVG